ncbi:MAG: hypothetical protein HWE14_10850 [Flavobacteriia bacterium]|nr:hypothetical protein [Flavobacteriia bacterium]
MAHTTTRGYRIIDKRLNGKLGILLASVNGHRYIVSIHFYFWGVQISKKNYEFDTETEAKFFFKRSLIKLLGEASV